MLDIWKDGAKEAHTMDHMVLGAQLYNLRQFTQSERDLELSLQKVAQIGYRTVQISGIGGGIPAERVRALCDRYALQITLTHTSPDRILNETEAVIREHDVMGCDYIGIGIMPDRYRCDAWLDRFPTDFLPAARRIAAAGKLLMYHNHEFEFSKINGRRVIEYLAESFAPDEMGFTLDTYWVQAGGGDVCAWISALAGRIPCVHLKDMDVLPDRTVVMAPIMEGNMNFPAILKALEAAGGVKYLLIEQDFCLESPFVCLEKSYRNLAALGYK
ncbi:MAG: sugar phosphate isomerase/epimerase [Clostridiales bacterium]|jgi:sugar phosphate isomerase/epimerase|nr:sugar phosphate isomerase/epimerase [Clostridiales bacterium]